MAKEQKKTTEVAEKHECCGGHHHHNPVLIGFKIGFGFWLAALAVLLMVSAVSTLLFYVM